MHLPPTCTCDVLCPVHQISITAQAVNYAYQHDDTPPPLEPMSDHEPVAEGVDSDDESLASAFEKVNLR